MACIRMPRAVSLAWWDKEVTKMRIHLCIKGFLMNVEKGTQTRNSFKMEKNCLPERDWKALLPNLKEDNVIFLLSKRCNKSMEIFLCLVEYKEITWNFTPVMIGPIKSSLGKRATYKEDCGRISLTCMVLHKNSSILILHIYKNIIQLI